MRFSKFGLKSKPRMRLLHSLVGSLVVHRKVTLSFPKAKAVKRLFLKMQSLESRGHYDRIRGRLNLTKRALSQNDTRFPFLLDCKVLSRPIGLRINDSTRLMELRVVPAVTQV